MSKNPPIFLDFCGHTVQSVRRATDHFSDSVVFSYTLTFENKDEGLELLGRIQAKLVLLFGIWYEGCKKLACKGQNSTYYISKFRT